MNEIEMRDAIMDLAFGITDIELKNRADKFVFAEGELHPVPLINAMNDLRYKNSAPVIAANQVGLSLRVLSVAGLEKGIFNPVVTFLSEKQVWMEEASVSYPGLVAKVKRPETIRIRFQDCAGVFQTEIFSGMTSRFIQQGVDQLDGIPFINRADRYHREMAYRQQRKAIKKSNG